MSIKLVKEFSWCKDYNIDNISVILSEDVVSILNSYKIKKWKHMKEVIKWLRSYEEYSIVNKRSLISLISEWRAHNLLYYLNFETERTKHVDLNDEKWYIITIYFILSTFYFGQ